MKWRCVFSHKQLFYCVQLMFSPLDLLLKGSSLCIPLGVVLRLEEMGEEGEAPGGAKKWS
jgi:hypothetical protein